MLGPGLVLSDRYRLDEHVATGGMGDVWRAKDVVLGRTVAVKVLLPALHADPEFDARFAAEARMLAGLDHPGVVNVFDYGESDLPGGARAVYLVMEYVDGEPLSERLGGGLPLDIATTMSIVAQAAEALDAAHASGIIHRDVKPGNLLVQPDGRVLLVDFGVARSSAATSVTGTNAIVGTAAYLAPEQASGGPVAPPTDIYALGAVAYHCLAGQPPFAGKNPLEVAVRHVHDAPPPLPAHIPPPVATLVERALAKDPADRFPSAGALAAAARAVLGEPAPAPTALVADVAPLPGPDTVADLPIVPLGPVGRRPTRRERRAGAAGLVGAAAAVALALGGLAAVLAFAPASDSPGNGTVPSSGPSADVVGSRSDDSPSPGRTAGGAPEPGAPASANPGGSPSAQPAGRPTPTTGPTSTAPGTPPPTAGQTTPTPAASEPTPSVSSAAPLVDPLSGGG